MSVASILHLLVVFAYLLASRAEAREHQHQRALHDLHLAMLYAAIVLIDVPLISMASALPGLLHQFTPAMA